MGFDLDKIWTLGKDAQLERTYSPAEGETARNSRPLSGAQVDEVSRLGGVLAQGTAFMNNIPFCDIYSRQYLIGRRGYVLRILSYL